MFVYHIVLVKYIYICIFFNPNTYIYFLIQTTRDMKLIALTGETAAPGKISGLWEKKFFTLFMSFL